MESHNGNAVWWCVRNPFHGKGWECSPYYMASTRKDAIKNMLRDFDQGKNWKHYHRQGFRCVKVTINELPSSDGGRDAG